jgi:hypothetical protein
MSKHNHYFDADGHIHVRNQSAYCLPEITVGDFDRAKLPQHTTIQKLFGMTAAAFKPPATSKVGARE